MANIKTIALTGAETAVYISGQNCDIRNDGTDIVYASAMPGVTAGADGVLSIPAGGAAKLLDTGGAVYLLGTGSVQLCGNDYSDQVFKVAATSSGGGGTEDIVARTAINAHAANGEIHLTADDAIEAAATAISNPNLLINPDFKINQRGLTEYTNNSTATPTYTVDGWGITASSIVTIGDNGIEFSGAGAFIAQKIENPMRLAGKTVTLSAMLNSNTNGCILRLRINGSWAGYGLVTNSAGLISVTITLPTEISSLAFEIGTTTAAGAEDSKYAIAYTKLELGSVATPFVPPDPATELAKCQRYFVPLDAYKRYSAAYMNTGNFVNFLIPLNTAMRTAPTIVGELKVYATRIITSSVKPEEGGEFSIVGADADNGIVIRWTKENHGLSDAVLEVAEGAYLSAEL